MDSRALITAYRRLSTAAGRLRFASPVRFVYNPLSYAREPAELYLSRYAPGRKEALFLGMNPGPWGMAQTGVPFGEISAARDWLHVSGRVSRPPEEHPRVPVRGFASTRSEVSGLRLWGLMRELFPDAAAWSRRWFVANYCPLLFLDGDGRNITPDKIQRADREALFPVCDAFLKTLVAAVRPRWLVGVGAFATQRLRAVVAAAPPGPRPTVISIPHPSPASPLANRGWASQARAVLESAGVREKPQGRERSTRTPM
jgi:single-strand selective monofunctional uracil DNA glycosylase